MTQNMSKAKAEIKKALDKEKAAKALQANSPLKTRQDLKGFWRQYPKARDLFGQIMVTWRGSTARRPGVTGCWAAYPYPWWSEKTKLPESTLRYYLKKLVEHGLVERQQGHHGGKRTLAFIRPTALALELSDGRPGDRYHLGLIEGGEAEKPVKPAGKPIAETALTPEKEDHPPQSMAELMAILKG
ncbi:hypothetical protein NA2_11620 [Nitratireductor pacificus pht-3B]|uniref:Uncharacterized protein n=2 Tax=Nitratireductor TaxID=245876 RepID=K2MDG4_9HYPH|nr:hypothetical protein NA2_11620 [Nitratireductor pacificus pht-3B]